MSREMFFPICVEAATRTAVAKATHVAPRKRPARRLLRRLLLSGRSSAPDEGVCMDEVEKTLFSSQTLEQEVSEAVIICCLSVEYSVEGVEEDMVMWCNY